MRIILTAKDLKKPLKINGQEVKEKERVEDIAQLKKDISESPEKIIDIVVTENYINININH